MADHAFDHAVKIVGARGAGQDRAAVFEKPDALVVVLADGAGGTSRGASAAQAIADAVAAADTDGCDLLGLLDGDPNRLGQGQATAVIISLSASGIAGASVGDSGAWLVAGGNVHELTAGQVRKPLVGDGCMPVAFSAGPLGPKRCSSPRMVFSITPSELTS